MSKLSRLIRNMVWSRQVFAFWQRLGVNVTKKHFYSPIPDGRQLLGQGDLWEKESELIGLDMNPQGQLRLLEVLASYKEEFDFAVHKTKTPHEFYLLNAAFSLEDAAVLHGMIRHFRPRTLIEVGGGYSTFVSARAGRLNQKQGPPMRLICIEPYPRQTHLKGFAGLDELIVQKVEQTEISLFEQLQENDILFIDSSHVVRIGGDVNFLYLEVLPRLKKGVVIHIHDIFLPYEYPREWLIRRLHFWTEQYLLQAFLCGNQSFEVLFANHYMLSKHPEKMAEVFVRPAGYRQRNIPNSFWIRKVR
ncbi:MAG: hypothetical protein AMJ79_07210 [Phycisphaerae bacterium SM23_30]|nr:MAG: hypothetical protein AMJ79_07210 [Phycisphaerae bacterium SM23_30]